MIRVTIIVREIGRLKPDYSLDFDLPEVPTVGTYISIQRPDKPEPFGEDLIVRKVWWRLDHPETNGFGSGPAKIGSVREIFVECDVAISPYSSDDWRRLAEGAKSRGIEIEEFEVARVSVRESYLKGK
ncbi:hypothetical protein MOV66_04475 [Agrobacterium sp. SHOUNA12C]|nr:hypothetical protein [Agrobacterium sp. BETTINA12B]MCJ9755887.1 hypothetical protein [Agrobacterium sp. SHOUNA12C]